MLLAQVSTGSLNDFVDREADAIHQPYKPIPSQQVSASQALGMALGAGAGALALAASCGPAALGVMGVGLASGWAYDLGLSRTPASWLPFTAGIVTVPRLGPAAIGARVPRPILTTALSGLLGLGLHLANAGPDIARDQAAGRRSLPVLLGPRLTRAGSHLALTVAALAVAATAPPRGARLARAGAASCLGLLVADRWLASPTRTSGRHPFVLPVLAAECLASGWLAGPALAPPPAD
jgi:4-hydroxybenzoate polyprenyltransferase